MQKVFDIAFGLGALFLGCGLLVASALHVIASVDMSPDVIAANAAAIAVRPAVPPRRLRPVPKHAVAQTRKHAPPEPGSLGAVPPRKRIPARTGFVALAARASARPQVRSFFPSAPRSPRFTPRPQIAPRPLLTTRPQIIPVALAPNPRRQKTPRAQRLPGLRQAPHAKAPFGSHLQPTLVGVAVDPSAFAPRLEGLRMRGRIVVPTPSPTPPYVPPVTRNGLTPGP